MQAPQILLVLSVVAFRSTASEILAVKCCPLGKQLQIHSNKCVRIKSNNLTDVSYSFVPLKEISNDTAANETEITDINDIYNDENDITNSSATEQTQALWLPEVLRHKVTKDSEIVYGRQKNCSYSSTVRLESSRDSDRMQWFVNGSFILRSHALQGAYEEHLIDPGEYCTDTFVDKDNATRRAYLLCMCDRVRCIRKCCPLGQTYIKKYFVATGRHSYKCGAYNGTWSPFDHRVHHPDSSFEIVTGKLSCKKGFEGHIELMWPGIPEHIIQSTWIETVGIDSVCEDVVVVRNVLASGAVVDVTEVKGVVRCFPHNPFIAMLPYVRWLHLAKVIFWALVIAVTLMEPRKPSPYSQVHNFALIWHALSLLVRSIFYMTKNLWDRYCIYSSLLFYFTATAASLWLSVLSINMACGFWKPLGGVPTLNRRQRCNPMLLWYSLYAWGVTGALTAFTGVTWYAKDVPEGLLRPTMHDIGTCFMETDPSQKLATFAYFYGPVGFLLLANVALYLSISLRVRQMRRNTSMLRRQREEEGAKQAGPRSDKSAIMYIKILLALGVLEVAVEIVTWLLNYNHGYFWFIVLWIDILRSFSMFVSTCCNKRTLQGLQKRFSEGKLAAAYRRWRAQRENRFGDCSLVAAYRQWRSQRENRFIDCSLVAVYRQWRTQRENRSCDLVAVYRQWRAQRENKEAGEQGVVGPYSISKECVEE